MKLVICCVRDLQIGAFMTPVFVQSAGQAVRMFSDEINRAGDENVMFRHPQDFEMWYVGTWDSDVGEFVIVDRQCLITGSACKVRPS